MQARVDWGRKFEMVDCVTVKKTVPIEIADPFARRLVGRYLENRQGDIGRLLDAVQTDDFETIRVTGHNLYGSGSAYGLDEVSRIGASLEKAAGRQDGIGISQLIDELADYLQHIEVL